MSISTELRAAVNRAKDANNQRRGRQLATICERFAVELRARFGWAGTGLNSDYFIPGTRPIPEERSPLEL